MPLDSFVDQYLRLVNTEINKCSEILETKEFKRNSEFAKVQGRLQGLKEAVVLLRSIPEDD